MFSKFIPFVLVFCVACDPKNDDDDIYQVDAGTDGPVEETDSGPETESPDLVPGRTGNPNPDRRPPSCSPMEPQEIEDACNGSMCGLIHDDCAQVDHRCSEYGGGCPGFMQTCSPGDDVCIECYRHPTETQFCPPEIPFEFSCMDEVVDPGPYFNNTTCTLIDDIWCCGKNELGCLSLGVDSSCQAGQEELYACGLQADMTSLGCAPTGSGNWCCPQDLT